VKRLENYAENQGQNDGEQKRAQNKKRQSHGDGQNNQQKIKLRL